MVDTMIQQVRSFNRAVTRRVGALSDDYLGRGRPLAESRLLFEIGSRGAEVRHLRASLSLDSGYLSRMLRSLEAQGLLTVRPSPHDARARFATLTSKGRREVAQLDQRSEAFAASLLAPLPLRQRERLVQAMAEVERLMRAAAVVVEVADPESAGARACINAYLAELAQRFAGGFDPNQSPSANPDELRQPNGVLLLASLDGQAIACGALKRLDRQVGEIKRMWVAPDARGLGVAQRLLEQLEQQAQGFGMRVLRLDTNRTLTEARALYERNGYRQIPAYNDNPYADFWFEKPLA